MDRKQIALRVGKIALGVLVTVLLLAGFAGSEVALKLVARQAENMSAGKVSVRGVHGSLYGPLSIEEASFQTEEKRYEIKQADLDWSPSALLRKHIQIGEISLRELLVIELKPSKEPPQFPETMRVPASLSIPKIKIERIVLKRGKSEQVLSDLHMAIEKPADTYRLNILGIKTPWGSAKGEASLVEVRPYDLSGHASLTQERGWPYQVETTVSGNLRSISLMAKGSSQGGEAIADTVLTPFQKRPLSEARIEASSINPALVRKDFPRAEISSLIVLRSRGEEAFAGEVSMQNAQPGPWDKGRVPVRALTAEFAGMPEQLELSAIVLDFAKAGRFEGNGRIAGERLELALSTRGFDPRAVHSTLRSMRLAGDLRLSANSRSQNLVADLGYQRYRLLLDAVHQDEIVEFRQASIRSSGGSLNLFGKLALAQPREFQIAGGLEGFNPAAFGDFPSARINASFTGNGRLAPEPQAVLRFAIADSRYHSQPLSGQGGLNLSAKRIWDSDVVLQLASNRLQAKGSLGVAGDRLDLRLDAENLAALGPDFNGRVNASGSLEGRFAALSGSFDVRATDFRWRKDYRIASIDASGRLEEGLDGRLQLDVNARDVFTPQLRVERASLVAQGQRTKHVMQLSAKSTDFDIEGSFAGGWNEAAGWKGQVLSLVNRGSHPFALKAPARLEVAPASFLLGDADISFAGGSFNVQEASYRAGQIFSRGDFREFPSAYLQQLAAQPDDFKTDLVLDGEWLIDARDKFNGSIAVRRDRGDVVLPTMPETALGLNQLALNIQAVDSQLTARLEANGTKLGSLKAEMRSALSRRDGAWGVAGDAPLQAAADLNVQSLAWAAPLIDRSGALVMDGALKAQVRGSGSFAQPRLTGTLEGERFIVRLPEQGLHFRDGRFQAELQDETLLLKNLSFQGGQGTLAGQGNLALKAGAPDLQVLLKADKLEVLSRPDRHLILSGTGEAVVAEKKVLINAKLKSDRGLIELPKGDLPRPSSDVVVLGIEEKTAAKKELPYLVKLDLDLDLGERFFFRGKGLDAQLGGAVKLASVNGGLPRANGSIRVVKGTYSAYGQRLEIERGILNFQGPVDNPGINVIAMRKNQEVEAGVAVTGSVQAPLVKLVSNPIVPDSEKLSWLVLGHGLEGSTGQDFSALQAAAGVLLSAGESVTLQQRIAHAAGLEEIGLKGAGTLESTVLTLGKRLSSRAYLSYEQGLTGADTLVKINYTLTKRLSVRGQAGTTPAVDLFYTFSFD